MLASAGFGPGGLTTTGDLLRAVLSMAMLPVRVLNDRRLARRRGHVDVGWMLSAVILILDSSDRADNNRLFFRRRLAACEGARRGVAGFGETSVLSAQPTLKDPMRWSLR